MEITKNICQVGDGKVEEKCARVGGQCGPQVAVILSSVSRALIAWSQRNLISPSVCMRGGSWMTLLHLRTQMRWAALDGLYYLAPDESDSNVVIGYYQYVFS